ncbi:uncharacterized protein BX663DRAFT_486535 [Cokeromyces recurvatus]|uniref:uncharacterized protein n=1 Tax=Cokeromyces recurvatus TaxID=90255 RepID=UPI00221F1232|nr:uncharacterized protein BX663DRAFT_486535 [Cokeromyces recurvatus]KAI7902731.1 hypothetical protein BX663DRAFT_486535 [Cokeromyces recurvatus]
MATTAKADTTTEFFFLNYLANIIDFFDKNKLKGYYIIMGNDLFHRYIAMRDCKGVYNYSNIVQKDAIKDFIDAWMRLRRYKVPVCTTTYHRCYNPFLVLIVVSQSNGPTVNIFRNFVQLYFLPSLSSRLVQLRSIALETITKAESIIIIVSENIQHDQSNDLPKTSCSENELVFIDSIKSIESLEL